MEDRVKLTADDSDYQNVMRRAGGTADAFGGKIQRASHGFESLFKRTPGRKAELAIHGLTDAIAGGDLIGGLTQFAGRISGLGLAAGVGLGVGIALFAKMREQINAVTEADAALNKELATPVSAVGALGPGGIQSHLEQVKKDTDELIKKSHTLGSRLQQSGFLTINTGIGRLDFGERPGKISEDIAAGKKRELDYTNQLVDAETEAARIKATALNLSEREAAEANDAADAEKRRGQLILESGLNKPGRDSVTLFKRFAAAKSEETTQQEATSAKFDFKEREAKASQLIADLTRQNLSVEEQRVKALEEQLKVIDEQLARTKGVNAEARDGLNVKRSQTQTELVQAKVGALASKATLENDMKIAKAAKGGLGVDQQKQFQTALEIKSLEEQLKIALPSAKPALELQKLQKENELRGLTTDPRKTNPFAFGTTAARDFETNDATAFGSLAQRNAEQNNPDEFGSLARAAKLRGETELTDQDKANGAPAVVAAIAELKTSILEVWRKP